jgi:hypothetical protein
MTAVLENLEVSADGREQHPAESVQFRHTISQFQIFRPVLPLPRCEVRPAHVKDSASASALALEASSAGSHAPGYSWLYDTFISQANGLRLCLPQEGRYP